MGNLNARQIKFVDHYLQSANATDSYIRAGYRVKNRDVAKSAASTLVKKLDLREVLYESIPPAYLVKKLRELLDNPSPFVSLRALEIALRLLREIKPGKTEYLIDLGLPPSYNKRINSPEDSNGTA